MERYFFLGDIHGSYIPIENLVRRIGAEELARTKNYLILLGDVGANFYLDGRDRKFKKKLGKYPFTYFCVRGNHEQRPSILAAADKDAWTLEPIFNSIGWVEDEFPYIYYAMDKPQNYKIAGLRTLVIPGAYSVDKYYRLRNGWTWFEEEQCTEVEFRAAEKIAENFQYEIDLVLSHTCPMSYLPSDLFLTQIDQTMVDKSMELFMGGLEYQLHYKFWLWGHYHKLRWYPQRDDGAQCIMLFNDVALEYRDGGMVEC